MAKLKFKKISLIFVLFILIFSRFINPVLAFSDYEQDVAQRIYQDLDQQYKIKEFEQNSLEYKTLKKLENNVIHSKFKKEKFRLHYIDNKLINAYYIGNGNIMIFRGLLEKLETEAQLAALISHEMGHAVNEHLSEDLERNLGLSLLNLLFNHFTDNEYQTITNIAQNLIANGYSREQERESDIYGVDLMLRSGYNPQALVELMEIFAENSQNNKLLEFTQTHPIPASRIDYLEKRIKKQKAVTENEGQTTANEIKNKRTKISTKKNKIQTKIFENQFISFNYPQNWEFKIQNNLSQDLKFKYQIESAVVSGQIYLEDLTKKEFMQTTAKQFQFEALRAKEKGFEISKKNLTNKSLNIYQLQLLKNDKLKLKYFISPKDKELMLSLDLDSSNLAETEKLVNDLINSLNYK